MNNLQAMIEHQCKGNEEKCSTYVISILLCIAENGGADAQAFNKLYEVLINSSCTVFNSEIVIYIYQSRQFIIYQLL